MIDQTKSYDSDDIDLMLNEARSILFVLSANDHFEVVNTNAVAGVISGVDRILGVLKTAIHENQGITA